MTSKKSTAKKYKAVVGITLEDGSRVEPGEPFPGEPAGWLVSGGYVEEIT